ncbi:uncharacterized protein LOC119692408 [Plutella xylostella]|uniref:uncharacterized protein LOC119692408 n=1 Tax=Plutella xylostella TaxID=51655 RepID=UPI0020324297|nr:uncharacterized protein LOC119692408 [Plutella xylostella]
MKPYRVARASKLYKMQYRSASTLGRLKLGARDFAGDICSMWHYGAPFPTFLKLLATLMLCVFMIMPLVYPAFLVAITYFTFESLYLSWWFDEPSRFGPCHIARRFLSASLRPPRPHDIWKVKEVMARGILLAHSLATSIDYLCVMQGLLE